MKYRGLAAVAMIFGTFGLSGCGGDPVEVVAKDACKCLRPIYSELDKMMSLVQGGDLATMAIMNSTMQESIKKTDACMAKVRNKHKEVDDNPEMRRKVTAKIEEVCPRPKMSFQ